MSIIPFISSTSSSTHNHVIEHTHPLIFNSSTPPLQRAPSLSSHAIHQQPIQIALRHIYRFHNGGTKRRVEPAAVPCQGIASGRGVGPWRIGSSFVHENPPTRPLAWRWPILHAQVEAGFRDGGPRQTRVGIDDDENPVCVVEGLGDVEAARLQLWRERDNGVGEVGRGRGCRCRDAAVG